MVMATTMPYVKKYVIGSPADNGGQGGSQNDEHEYLWFRLADVYLVYADAILGNTGTTSDPEALKWLAILSARVLAAYTKTLLIFVCRTSCWKEKWSLLSKGMRFTTGRPGIILIPPCAACRYSGRYPEQGDL